MIIGITGTQAGATDAQLETLRQLFFDLGVSEVHHGDCIGADAQAHKLAQEFGAFIVIHPPNDPKKRAWCQGATFTWPERPYLRRNHDIVDMSELLIAMPKETEMVQRSGTWATVRYAVKTVHQPHYIIWPDGSKSEWMLFPFQ